DEAHAGPDHARRFAARRPAPHRFAAGPSGGGGAGASLPADYADAVGPVIGERRGLNLRKAMTTATSTIQELANREYKYGFVTEVEADTVPRGLNEEIIRQISAKKREPEVMLQWRLETYPHRPTMEEPRRWPNIRFAPIDYQDIVYYSAPKPKKKLASMDEVDPELRQTFEKLGISLEEQKRLSGVAVDAVFDSVSVATTFKTKLAELGVIFCSF